MQKRLEERTGEEATKNPIDAIDSPGLVRDKIGDNYAPKRRYSEGFWKFPGFLAATSVIPLALPEEQG